MRIGGFRAGPGTFGKRFSGTVTWEDSERPPVEIWWDIDDDLANDAAPDPNAFLAAAYVPARRHGERRIAVEGTVCPVLADGLGTIGALLRSWRSKAGTLPAIEPADGWRAPVPREPAATAGYLTGGVDSLHLFHANRTAFPPDHPDRLTHALWIRGLDYPGAEEGEFARARYVRLDTPISEIAADLGVHLVRITTSVRRLDPDLSFLAFEFLGGALLSGAHLLARRFTTVALGSSWPAEHLVPWGTHPLLDPRYGSGALSIRHEALGLRRVEKLALLRGWPAGLSRLVTCSDAPAEKAVNCGRCTKCIRALVEMEASGTLAEARSFPDTRVDAATIDGLEFGNGTEYFWRTLVEPIRAAGRNDLAAAIERKIRQTVRRRRRIEGRDWTGTIRRWDRKVFGGRLKRTWRRIFT